MKVNMKMMKKMRWMSFQVTQLDRPVVKMIKLKVKMMKTKMKKINMMITMRRIIF